MKTPKYKFLFALIFLVISLSCKKSNDPLNTETLYIMESFTNNRIMNYTSELYKVGENRVKTFINRYVPNSSGEVEFYIANSDTNLYYLVTLKKHYITDTTIIQNDGKEGRFSTKRGIILFPSSTLKLHVKDTSKTSNTNKIEISGSYTPYLYSNVAKYSYELDPRQLDTTLFLTIVSGIDAAIDHSAGNLLFVSQYNDNSMIKSSRQSIPNTAQGDTLEMELNF